MHLAKTSELVGDTVLLSGIRNRAFALDVPIAPPAAVSTAAVPIATSAFVILLAINPPRRLQWPAHDLTPRPPGTSGSTQIPRNRHGRRSHAARNVTAMGQKAPGRVTRLPVLSGKSGDFVSSSRRS